MDHQENHPDFSSNFIIDGKIRKLRYSTGRDKGGYRCGFEGTYAVKSIEETSDGFVVSFNAGSYGLQKDLYNEHSFKNRKGNGFKLDSWPISVRLAMQFMRWRSSIK